MRKFLVLVAAVIASWLLALGAGAAEGEKSYYPLKEGLTWEYTATSDKAPARKITIKNLAPQNLFDRTAIPREWHINGGSITYYVIEDETGVYRIAKKEPGQGEPVKTTPLCYLRYPLSEGTSWDITTPIENRELEINLVIYSMNDTVKVAAGTFKDCLKIKHVGQETAPTADAPSLSLEAFEWFAPGVGLVKSLVTIRKKGKDQPPSSEMITYELLSFK